MIPVHLGWCQALNRTNIQPLQAGSVEACPKRTSTTAHKPPPHTAQHQPSTGPPAQRLPARNTNKGQHPSPDARTRPVTSREGATGEQSPAPLIRYLLTYFRKIPAQPSSPHRGSIRGSPTHYPDGKALRINSLRLPLCCPMADNRHQSDRAKPNSQH